LAEQKIGENMLETGQIKTVDIIDMNHMGQGVAKIDDFVVFVDKAIEGDKAEVEVTEVKKNYAVGNLLRVIKPSKDRIDPPCVHFKECGGCQLMHLDYSAQLRFKKNRVANELRRSSVNMDEAVLYDTIGMDDPFRYRNKTAFSVTERDKDIIIGTYEQGTYNTVDLKSCLIQSDGADKAVNLFRDLMAKYKIPAYDKRTGKGIIKNIVIRNNRNSELMIVIVTSSENLPGRKNLVSDLREAMPNIKTIVQNINSRNTNLIMGDKNIVLSGNGTIEDKIGELYFTVSSETFFQINAVQTEKLYEKAIEFADIDEDDVCFDIYCGIGTISLMAAKHAKKVYGVEIVEQSIINARENAKANRIFNAEFFAGKAEKVVPKLYRQNIKADVVIVDPPRKGCEKEVIDTMIEMSPKRIVYVSCNPSTLARDLKLLEEGDYILKKVQPVDQFPWTVHVEAVTLLVRE
jgi:23S rRNA (uracil1939-C5)-methyltransferase